MELRHLRYFVAVAEELHFGRAAERLYMAAPPLSQRIKELERELGTRLFERSTRSVSLTEAGERLLPTARETLRCADDLARRAATGATPEPGVLRVGVFCHGLAELTAPVLTTFRRRHPDVRVSLTDVPYGHLATALLSGAVDAVLAFGPIGDDRVELVEVASEPRRAFVSSGDPLADASSLRLADIVDREYLRSYDAGGSAAWASHWMLGDVRPVADARVVGEDCRSIPEAQARIALGEGIGTATASVARFYPYPGVRTVPLDDAPPTAVGIAVRRDGARGLAGELLADAIDVARDLGPALLGTTA
jgi:LysR family transcriptional regulator, benzoate and cis,cis-muconate-responsive activator of ben and cat genes